MQRSALHEKSELPLPEGGMKATRRANARENKDGSELLWEGMRTPLDFCAEENYFPCGRKSEQERNIYNSLINNQLA